MKISEYSKDEFGKMLATVVNSSGPIRSIQHLKGREQQLEDISRSLYTVGRHIFVCGDRGVGKSSLAATAAYQYQSADAEPIFVSGSPDDTFQSVVANIAVQALDRSKTEINKKNTSAVIAFRGLQWSVSNEVSTVDIASQINSIGDATELLKQVARAHSEKPTIVLDEFDTIENVAERAKFASLLKQLGDQQVNLKFLITGVGKSCDELLGAHQSAHRQLATINLPRLGFEGRREIVQDAADTFEVELDSDVNWRIALISDGFPYYVHLLTEKMLWAAFDSKDANPQLGWNEFHEGLRAAVTATNEELKRPYEKAVLLHAPEWEDIVWSTADGDDLLRSIASIRSSYEHVTSRRLGRESIDQQKFGGCIRKLREPAYGSILKSISGRNGWYEYSEKMLRGYVRMQAEVNGITLNGDQAIPRQQMHISNSRTGSYGPSLPRGVDQHRRISPAEADDAAVKAERSFQKDE